jgi:catechol 2,3-dioxygenase-like lactoylglutathione lyase family enzyme
MKRFHVHLTVHNLDEGIAFYNEIFAQEPAVQKPDYAKWMLEDPRVNFAISTRRAVAGVNHLGFQVDSDEELADMRNRAARAGLSVLDEPGASCCYARSDKHWITDPANIAWEVFHTLGDIPLYGDTQPAVNNGKQKEETPTACCPTTPATGKNEVRACCGPN